MRTNTIINTDFNTYLVKFQFQSTENCFIVQGSGLMDCLKKYDKNGVKSITEFDPAKGSFKRVSRADILQCYSWDTETYIYLTGHYYFR